ncbi:enoyl-ACP reductase FabI [Actinomycetospora sp. OC33-EN08]|uniref:Enoyl-[acyl-carrier-protein] reductase [NADH] n=1 Tax=Actinomycetospora aurantiaca TaxID=3129233 RepID=A0ABU8MWA4_9PSEU
MGLLDGKRILITGIITDASIAFHVAKAAQEAGATLVVTAFGRVSLVKRIAQRLPEPPPVIELDVQNQEHLDGLADAVREHVDGLDGVLHSIGFAPASALGEGAFLNAPWSDVATAIEVSAFSLKSLAVACKPLMGPGSSIVGMDFDNRVAWPAYDWMGVAKSALESTTRYLARDLGPDGIRVNLVAAGPIKTMAAKSIPGFQSFEQAWTDRAPLGWDLSDPTPVAKTVCAVLSDWMPTTTGEMIHADGGFHAVGV